MVWKKLRTVSARAVRRAASYRESAMDCPQRKYWNLRRNRRSRAHCEIAAAFCIRLDYSPRSAHRAKNALCAMGRLYCDSSHAVWYRCTALGDWRMDNESATDQESQERTHLKLACPNDTPLAVVPMMVKQPAAIK